LKAVDVLITAEHVDRELDATSCIAYLLEQHFQLRVEVRNFYADYPFLVDRLRPEVLAVPFFYFRNHAPMQQFLDRWPHARVLNLAWEQILYKMNQSIKVPSDECARRDVWHVCWTEDYRRFLEGRGVDPGKLLLTGNPVMKFYDAPYRAFFTGRQSLASRYGLDGTRKWLLFPENYRWGFLTDGQIENFVQLGGDLQELLDARAYCQRSMREVLRWLARVCRESGTEVIVRPRPATAAAQIRAFAHEAVGDLPPTLHIIKGESAREWILASDHVVSSYSTTLIEASLCGKPVHLATSEPLPGGLHDEWYGLVPWIESEEAMVRWGCATDLPATGGELERWARARLMGHGDPIRNIAVAIAALHPRYRAQTPQELHARLEQRPALALRGLSPVSSLVSRTRKRLMALPAYQRHLARRHPAYVFTSRKHEKDLFGAHDVRQRIIRWSHILR
jgi:surface carbohydrate biosynthesis protein